MTLHQEEIDVFKNLLEQKQHIAIISHYNPDGDAIGSSLALASVLRNEGHTVTCIVPNKYAYYLNWIPEVENIIVYANDNEHKAEDAILDADMLIGIDLTSFSRAEAVNEIVSLNTTAKRVLIDHHLSPSGTYDVMFSYPEISSASELAYTIISAIYGCDVITKQIATQLYVGIMTDTGNFSYSHLSPDLFSAVSVLSRTGINIQEIYNNVYNAFTESRARLMGYVINWKMKLLLNGTVAYMSLSMDEMRKFWFKQGDSEGFVNYPLTIKKMKMSAFFSEQDNFIRVSLRSRGNVDVDEFARRFFNGGGHMNASGGKSFQSLKDTIKHYIDSVEIYHKEGKV
ncbi:MAG: DHH family phosphoesterase [Alistipes sp.]|nr:DHH family phosphoesterase [Candidatus Alistipes equi]